MTEQELNKACAWIEKHGEDYIWVDPLAIDTETEGFEGKEMAEDFRKAMTDKTNPLFEQALANVNPETRTEVRGNMDAALLWHKASEGLPKETGKVLICNDNGRGEAIFLQVAMYTIEANGEGHFIECHYCDKVEPDYWMEIPELKKED